MLRHPIVVAGSTAAVLLVAGAANAQQETCPPGSLWKSQDGAGWCEPTVCGTDLDCKNGEVCKPIPLCVEIGKTDPKAAADAGPVLMARQKCGENKSCPQSTVCSDKGRCISKATAEKLGLLATPIGSSGGSDTPAPPKKACGCRVPGEGSTGGGLAALLAVGALGVVVARRRYKMDPR